MKTIALILSVALLLTACKNKQEVARNTDEYYTCSMHPQVMQDHPGTCPICHMELIAVKKTTMAADEMMLNDEQVRLGNIQVDTIKNGTLGSEIVLTAILNTDEKKVNSVNARITGRIDRLYYKNVGDYISKGAHLYDLYSEELNTAKQEYIAALERRDALGNSLIDFDRLVQSAKSKLILWGLGEAQVADLAKNKQASPLTAFYSTVSGYITELPVAEGQYVMEGGTVVKLADLSTLWVEAQVYASSLSSIDYSGTATVRLPDLPGKEWKGTIEFANPEISSGTRVNLVRVSIPNTGNQLKPGMPAYVIFNNKQKNTLALPLDAVLRDGKMNHVWVQTAPGHYRRKMVTTGMESGDFIEIKSGLQNGDVVVTSGAYLLNSEYVFKNGADAMSEHHHH